MSGKDDYIFNKPNLLTTQSGRKIFKSGLIRDKKYASFKFYLNKSKKESLREHGTPGCLPARQGRGPQGTAGGAAQAARRAADASRG
jgi:hypothetical protein